MWRRESLKSNCRFDLHLKTRGLSINIKTRHFKKLIYLINKETPRDITALLRKITIIIYQPQKYYKFL